jgi:hypothetical protein
LLQQRRLATSSNCTLLLLLLLLRAPHLRSVVMVLQVPAMLLLLVPLLLRQVPLSCRGEAGRPIQVPAAPLKRTHHARHNLRKEQLRDVCIEGVEECKIYAEAEPCRVWVGAWLQPPG